MSTKIDDLPIPKEEVKEPIVNPELISVDPNQTNIRAEIIKKVQFEEPTNIEEETTLMNEINEENLIIFAILFVAALPSITPYILQIPFIGSYANNDIIASLIKASIIIILFIVFKRYLRLL